MTTVPLSAAALAVALALTACGGDDGNDGSTATSSSAGGSNAGIIIPAEPAGLGYVETADVQEGVKAYVDDGDTNIRATSTAKDGTSANCHATVDTNAGVRLLQRFLDLWKPATLLVDAGINSTGCQTITAYTGDGMDGTILNAAVHQGNIQYSIDLTAARTASQAEAAYYDDRRNKGYSITDGLGPLTSAYRTAAQQTTTITSIPSDATTALYSDSGNNLGVDTAGGNTSFGDVVNFVGTKVTNGDFASAEPTKRFYKYARPWRWSSSVVVVPTLVPAKGTTAATDGGFPSGHTAEGMRDALALAYVLPERFQELVARAQELGDNRIMAGMHSRLDVMGGRMLGIAAAVYGLNNQVTADDRKAAYDQAHAVLMNAVGASDLTAFYDYAHSGVNDRFSDAASVKAKATQRLAYGFATMGDTTKSASVPKGAEVLLETRLPYLTADQRRVVLKTTAIGSGYPLLDDDEGYGRLNLVAAADGYGAFNGDVTVSMDASLGGFNVADSWRNDIAGAGKLTKQGSGTLTLTGANTYTGGTVVQNGSLVAGGVNALGKGVVYLNGNGVLKIASGIALQARGDYVQTGNAVLSVTAGSAAALQVAGTATLGSGSTLRLAFGNTPSAGQVIPVIQAGKLSGQFGSIELPQGVNATPVYEAGGMSLRIL